MTLIPEAEAAAMLGIGKRTLQTITARYAHVIEDDVRAMLFATENRDLDDAAKKDDGAKKSA